MCTQSNWGAPMQYWAGLFALLVSVALPISARSQSLGDALRAHGGPVRALAAMVDGRLASAGFDSTIVVWDLTRGKAVRVLRLHDTAVNALVARPDGCLVSGGEDSRIKVWCETAAAETLEGHTAAVAALAVSKDGAALISGSWDGTVRLWDRQGAGRVLAEHAAPVTSVALAADGASAVSASQDGAVRITRIDGTAPSQIFKIEVPITGVVATPDGDVVLVCADGTVRQIDQSFTKVRELAALTGPLTAIALSPDGTTLAASGLRTPVTFIDRRTGATKPMPAGSGLLIWTVAFSRDGTELFTGGGDRAVRRFEAATGNPRAPTIATVPEPELASTKERGARVFRACVACHGVTAQDTNLAGPTLHQIMGRRIASLNGYEFSRPLTGMEIVWTAETISKLFEVGPRQFTPGTKMPEQRITDPEDRQALVEWLARVTVP
jgi:cytochrome c